MKKNNNIKINQFDSDILKVDYKEKHMNLVMFKDISILSKMSFAEQVVNLIVHNGFYHSFIKELIFDYLILINFTNIDFYKVFNIDTNDEIDLDFINDFLQNTNAVDKVKEYINPNTLIELQDTIDKNIEIKTGYSESRLVNTIVETLNTINKLGSQMDSFNLQEQIDLFKKITNEISSEKIIKAYEQSDSFKKIFEDEEITDKPKVKI